MSSAEVERAADTLNALTPEVRQRFLDMVNLLPRGESDGGAGIIASLIEAGSPEALNAPWEADSTKSLVGKVVQINGVKVRDSDYTEGLGVFLVVEAVNLTTGEAMVFTTGAGSVVSQLVIAHAQGWMPLVAEIVQSSKPTKDGYYPIHLRVIESKGGKGGAASARTPQPPQAPAGGSGGEAAAQADSGRKGKGKAKATNLAESVATQDERAPF